MYIGIDYGTKRVGVAISDEEGRVAFPLETVPEKEALGRLQALAAERKVHTFVIGESKNFAGEDNPVMARIKPFAERLREIPGARVIFEPEFMTSAAAVTSGVAEEHLDAAAAALILQSFLDKRSLRA